MTVVADETVAAAVAVSDGVVVLWDPWLGLFIMRSRPTFPTYIRRFGCRAGIYTGS